jgi:hypothetical protein
METMTTGNQNNQDDRNAKIYRITIISLVVIIAFLTFFLITSRKSLKEVTADREFTEELNMALQAELDSVLFEYNVMKLEYDSILVDKDSIIQENAMEIQRLIARQADYNRIRRQLDGLREITQNYVREIDSLVTVNMVLKEENVQIREEIRQARVRTTALVQDKEELAGKVEVASVIRAYQLDASAVRMRSRDREEETDRAVRAERMKVCFTLAENPIAPTGYYNIYVRIAAPDGQIYRLGDTDEYSFVNEGDTLQYSVVGRINYQNRELSSCLYWDRIREFEAGQYLISLYSDDLRLGETTVTLR